MLYLHNMQVLGQINILDEESAMRLKLTLSIIN